MIEKTNKELCSSLEKEQSSFSTRLRSIMGKEKESSFALKCNLPLSTLRKYLNGSTPGLDKAVQIANSTGVSLHWLATGEGTVLPRDASEHETRMSLALVSGDEETVDELSELAHKEKITPLMKLYREAKEGFLDMSEITQEILATGIAKAANSFGFDACESALEEIHSILVNNSRFKKEFALVPGYKIQASAGGGALAEESHQPCRYLAFRKKWLTWRGFNESDLAIIWAKGDSMEPTISDNDTLVVHLGRTTPLEGYIYIFRIGGELYVKRYQNIIGTWRLISDNSLYNAIDVKKEEQHQFEVIGQVVHIAKDLGG